MKILLTPEEIDNVICKCDYEDSGVSCPLPITPLRYEKEVAKAQARKILNWGNETCTNQQHRAYYITMAEDAYYTKRHECKFCWQELERAIEG